MKALLKTTALVTAGGIGGLALFAAANLAWKAAPAIVLSGCIAVSVGYAFTMNEEYYVIHNRS